MARQARGLLVYAHMYRAVALSATLCGFLTVVPSALAQMAPKLDPVLQSRAANPTGRSHVIVKPLNATVDFLVQALGGTLGRPLPIVNGRAADVPDAALALLAASGAVQRVAFDRPTAGLMERTASTIGAAAVRDEYGYTGHGVGIALVDSGIAVHDDLAGSTAGSQRVDAFVDFVNGRSVPYDDMGHGTHVAGIAAGNGYDSGGARAGIAPNARLAALKVLDEKGNGRISQVIAALDYVSAHRTGLNLRIVNISVGAAVLESYESDLLAQATRRLVEQGVVIVAAAGNQGRNAAGASQSGGITAPGNAPWVLTVGASSHLGTVDRGDDVVAGFSSRGPTAIDRTAKPDLVAPGVGIESLSVQNSRLATTHSSYLLDGTVPTPFPPYLSLSGTSMAAPVVTGTVALMLEANPALTPNAVKAILQYTAEAHPGDDALSQGAGFLNARGAVELARAFADPAVQTPSAEASWSAHIIWGNHRVAGGWLMAGTNAWAPSLRWGADPGAYAAIVWGRTYTGTAWAASGMWTTNSGSTNVVWGSACGGADCTSGTWSNCDGDTVVWGTSDGDTVVWGTTDGDTVVWGTSCGAECDSDHEF
jgi:serine protease AprX